MVSTRQLLKGKSHRTGGWGGHNVTSSAGSEFTSQIQEAKDSGHVLPRGPGQPWTLGGGGRQGPQHWSHLDTQEHSFRSPRFPTISHSHTNLVNLPFPSATCVANTTPSPHPDCLPLPQQTVSWPCTPQREGREEEKGLSTLKYSAGPEAS